MNIFRWIYEKLGPIPLLLLVVGVAMLIFTTPLEQELHLKQRGIEFNKDSKGSEKIIEIIIDGKYKTTLLGNHDEFKGTIMIGDKKFEYKGYSLIFNKEGMASLDIDAFTSAHRIFGMIYVKRNMEKMIIEEFSERDNGVSQNNGWFIVTPAQSIGKAIEIAKELSKKAGRNLLD